MSVTKQVTIWCEGFVLRTRIVHEGVEVKQRTAGRACSEWVQLDESSGEVARRTAKDEGWSRSRDGKDLCHWCTQDRAQAGQARDG